MMRRGPLCFALLFVLTACGGGGSTIPATAPTGPTTTQGIAISILIPAASTAAAHLRRPAYVSAATQSASIAVNGAPAIVIDLANGAPGCTTASNGRTCTASINAPGGSDTFTEKLYASTNGTGTVLAQGTTQATISPGTANTVSLTLDGVPATVTLALANATPPQNGSQQSIGLTATIKDAGGSAIIGAAAFTSPITLTDSDKSGVTSLPTTILNSPNDAAQLTVSYTGAALSTPAVFGASGASLASGGVTAATLTPKSQTVAPSAFNDYTTFGYDNQRDVFNPNSTAITPSSLSGLHLAWQTGIGDYNTQTQPILATGISGHAGVLILGGGSGKVYGYDATTGAQMWKRPTGQLTYTCATAGSTIYFGIGGTGAYDSSSKTFYIVGNSNPAINQNSTNTLFHMDAATGAVINSVDFAPYPVGPSELDFSHTSVTLGANGLAYVGTGATCDISSWRGRVAVVDTNSMTLSNQFFPSWNPSAGQYWGGGGVWGWGGVSLDSAGSVYTGTGNTDNGTTTQGQIVPPFVKAVHENDGYGEAFLKLSPGLNSVQGSVHPIPQTDYAKAEDLDINGTPVLFTPNGVGCDPMAAIQGKAGALVLMDTARIGNGPVASYQLAPPTYEDQFIGDPAYSPATGLVYEPVPVGSGSLYPPGMIAVDPGCGSPSVAWHSQFGPDSNLNGNAAARSVPAVSAGGVVFVGTPCQPDGNGGCNGSFAPTTKSSASRSAQAVRKPQICCAPPGNAVGGAVWALDASTGQVLNGGLPLFTTPGVIRMPPTIDGDWIFVIDNAGNMYGLTVDSKVPSIQSVYHAADARSTYRWEAAPRRTPI